MCDVPLSDVKLKRKFHGKELGIRKIKGNMVKMHGLFRSHLPHESGSITPQIREKYKIK